MKTLACAASSMLLIAVAWMCLIRPQIIQAYALSSMRGKWFPSKDWVKTSQYIFSIRACGVIALLMGLVLAWVVLQKPRGFL